MCKKMRSSTLVASALLVAALCVAGAGAFPVKQGEEEGATIQALREDITNPVRFPPLAGPATAMHSVAHHQMQGPGGSIARAAAGGTHASVLDLLVGG